MPIDPFQAALLKVGRARRHIDELELVIKDLLRTDFCSVEVDEDEGAQSWNLVLRTKEQLPTDIPLALGDAAHNLRSSLDILVNMLVSARAENAASSSFPLHESQENLRDKIDKGNIRKHYPELADLIFGSICPFKDGNFLLWALNKLDIVDKHRLIVPVFAVTKLSGLSARDENNNVFQNMTVAVGPGGRMNLIRTRAKLYITNLGVPSIAVIFDSGHPFEGEPVVSKLREVATEVTAVIEAVRVLDTQ